MAVGCLSVVLVGEWWLVAGDWWLVAGGWWLVAGEKSWELEVEFPCSLVGEAALAVLLPADVLQAGVGVGVEAGAVKVLLHVAERPYNLIASIQHGSIHNRKSLISNSISIYRKLG